jgi:hypothetical protein
MLKTHERTLTMENKKNSFPENVVCCFCGTSVKYINAVELIIKPNPYSDEKQTLYSHKTCLSNLIDVSIPIHPDIMD